MTGHVVGIDLGTSNTVAVIRSPDGRRRPVLFDGAPLMPSAVYLQDNGQLAVGRDAQRLAQLDPARYEPNPKRRIDEPTVLLGNTEVPTREMLAAVLGAVAAGVAEVTRTPPPVVLTYPASWAYTRRTLLQEAATRAGWRQVTLVPEPVAAARYFISALNHPLPRGAAMVVYDFGGGTVDIAVVRHDEAGFTVIGAGGLEDVGGLDLDATLVEHVGGLLRRTDPVAWQRLQQPATAQDRRDRRLFWEDVRGAKEMLSRTATAPVSVPGVEAALHLTRDELESLVEPMLRQTVAETARVVAGCRLAPDRLAGIMLVGGSSRVPLVARMLHRSLGVVPTVLEQPELPVAEGAVVHPAELAGAPATGTASVGVPYQTQGYPAQQLTSHSGVVYGSQTAAAVPVSPPVAPVSAVPASGLPVSGAPVSGVPVSSPPMSGAPVSGVPVSSPPVSSPPVSVSGAPAAPPPAPRRRRRLALVAGAVAAAVLAGAAGWYLTRPDPLGSWETLPKVPVVDKGVPAEIEGAGAAFFNGELYVIGGMTAANPRTQLTSVWIFNPGDGRWRPGPELQQATTQMAVVVTPGNQLKILGGYTGRGATANTYVLDGDRWSAGTPLPEPRLAGAAVHDGTTTIFAGGTGSDGRARDTIWKLNPDGTAWTQLTGRLQHPRTKLTAGTDGAGTAWFIGGNGDGTTYADIDTVVQGEVKPPSLRLPQPREAPSAVVLEGYGLCVLGGHDGERMYQWWCDKDGVADRLPALAVPRAGMAVTTTGNTVYAVGGYNTVNKSNGSTDAERFTAEES
ncbi:Hsp70 family protein [Dactylosporangium aurantiacum]|uniref:Hsp70 family protein n=1 Tax=Dactylosporangium aurantiacum TaxID=35754 RepID=A0A9Q9MJL4_9ACTN|nr:Hsp70 family protein [Dactylosporangium aurantiacum]MDG6105642.1 Hsp70 family protein [Dactylosporangium aurantiacum]UWZ57025.1 Hsp70 family protein [Dactylosporangium aurantiacum]